MTTPRRLYELIEENLQPRIVEGPIEVGPSFDSLVCPICLASSTFFGDFGGVQKLEHDKRCYWAHNKIPKQRVRDLPPTPTRVDPRVVKRIFRKRGST